MTEYNLDVEDRVYFSKYKRPFIVKACNDRFAICVKPYGKQNKGKYTIIDWEKGLRNKNNMIFNPYDYMVQEDIDRCLRDLSDPEHVCEISHRGAVKLDIIKVVEKKKNKKSC